MILVLSSVVYLSSSGSTFIGVYLSSNKLTLLVPGSVTLIGSISSSLIDCSKLLFTVTLKYKHLGLLSNVSDCSNCMQSREIGRGQSRLKGFLCSMPYSLLPKYNKIISHISWAMDSVTPDFFSMVHQG